MQWLEDALGYSWSKVASTTLLQILDMQGCTLTPLAKKTKLFTTLFSSLRCKSTAEHHSSKPYSKPGWKKRKPDLRINDRSCMKYWQYTKHLSCSSGIKKKMLPKVILASKVALNITRSSDSFRTVPARVNGVDWGWIVLDLETIIVLSLFAILFPTAHNLLRIIRSYSKIINNPLVK